MVTFRNNSNNNNRRNNFRRNDRSFKSNGDRPKFGSSFSNNENFKRKAPGDKILSENYLQHADHFTRVLNERESIRKEKFADNKSVEDSNVLDEPKLPNEEISKNDLANVPNKDNEEEKVLEPQT